MAEQQPHLSTKASPEQVKYANILFYGAWLGIFMMMITYLVYITGILDVHVPLQKVITNWHTGIHDYLPATNSPTGWDWAGLLGKGDFLNFIPIAWLALLTILCYFTLMPGYLKRKDYTYLFIAITEVVVLAVAASGLLGSGGH